MVVFGRYLQLSFTQNAWGEGRGGGGGGRGGGGAVVRKLFCSSAINRWVGEKTGFCNI